MDISFGLINGHRFSITTDNPVLEMETPNGLSNYHGEHVFRMGRLIIVHTPIDWRLRAAAK